MGRDLKETEGQREERGGSGTLGGHLAERRGIGEKKKKYKERE